MAMLIFFGGIVLGFLIGFIAMALLSAANYQNKCEQLNEALVYHRIMTGQYDQTGRCLSLE